MATCTTCSSNTCNCNTTPLKYNGPALDCLGVVPGVAYDALMQSIVENICDLNTSLDGFGWPDHVSFTSSTGIPSNVAGQAGETDTYTVWLDIGETESVGVITTYNGLNGTSGSSIIDAYNSTTGGIGNTSPIGADTLFSHVIPANTLSTDGDELEIQSFLGYIGPDQVDISFELSPTDKYSFSFVTTSESQSINIKIARVNVNSQLWIVETISKIAGATSASELVVFPTAFDLSTDATFKLISNNTVIGANQVATIRTVIKKNLV